MKDKFLLWTIKHKPKNVNEIVGNEEAKKEFLSWLDIWLKGKIPVKKAVLLYGPPGVGKTLLVEVSAKQFNLELIEINAGDISSAEIIRKVALGTSKESSFENKMKIILIDELDSIEGAKLNESVPYILELISESLYPVVLIANDGWKPELWQIRNVSYMIEMKRLTTRQIIGYLEKICKEENLEYEESALKIIAERSEGDMRSAILDLQLVSIFKKVGVKEVNLLAPKDRQLDVFTVIRKIIYATTFLSAKTAAEEFPYDPETLMLWLNENIPRFYTTPSDLATAYDRLSQADIFKNIAEKQRYWRFLLYFIEEMTAGVALAKTTKPTYSYAQFPSTLKLLGKQRRVREIKKALLEKIARLTHMSTKKANLEAFWYFLILFKNNEFREKAIRYLNLDKETQEYLINLSNNIKI
jgi:DNA polymerase III, gamma/tau subunits